MAARQPATVKVLHRATDEIGSDGDSPTSFHDLDPQQQVHKLSAENEALQQRLDQAKATSASERKRLADELKIERAGRQRAEEILVKQAKELESVTAAKGRLEDAFSRSMAELRYTRLEHAQAEETIQQLLRELMLLRDIINRVTSVSSAASGTAATAAGSSHGSSGDLAEAATSNGIATTGRSALAAAAAGVSNKRISRSKLLGELQQLRQAKAAAESNRDSLLQRLGALEAEKERAEESQEMISRETAKLLDDKRKLLTDLGSKDEAVRGLAAGLDHLQHQLELALNDRQLLLEQLTKVADVSELEALQAVIEDSDRSSFMQGDEEYTQEQQQHEQQHQLLLQELEQMKLQQHRGRGLDRA